MASFSAPPRKLDFSQLGITQSKNTDARPDISDANDLDSKDEPGITASLKFDPPHSGESATPKANIGVRPFQPLYQKPFPTDITPFAQAIDEEAIWNEFLAKAKERGIELGKRATAVRSYIKVGGWKQHLLTTRNASSRLLPSPSHATSRQSTPPPGRSGSSRASRRGRR